MAKTLICDRCKKEVGEMTKGKIKKDAVVICGRCNYELLMLANNRNNEKKGSNPMDIFNEIFNK